MTQAKKTLAKLNSQDIRKFQNIVAKLYEKMNFTIKKSLIIDGNNICSILTKKGEFGGVDKYFVHVFRNHTQVSVDNICKALEANIPPDSNKIIFATTSSFSDEAKSYAGEHKVELKDGAQFYELLRRYEIFRAREPQKEKEDVAPVNEEKKQEGARHLRVSDHVKTARALMETTNYYEALKEVNTALSLESDNLDALTSKSRILYRLGQLDNAFEFNDQLLRSHPENAEIMLLHSKILRSQGRNESALTFTDKALGLNPQNGEAMIERGTIHKSLRNYDEAVNSYNKAIMNDPNNWNAWYLKGICLALGGKFDESVRSFAEALLISPENLDILKAKRDVLLKLKEKEDAHNRRKFYAIFRRGINDIFDVIYTTKEHLDVKWKLSSQVDKGELSFTPHYITFFGENTKIEIGVEYELSRVKDNINKDIIWKELTYTDADGEEKVVFFSPEKKLLGRSRGATKDLYSAFQNWQHLKREEECEVRDRLALINKKIGELEEKKSEMERQRELEMERFLEREAERRAEEERLAKEREMAKIKEEEKKKVAAKKKTKLKRCPQCKEGKIVVPIHIEEPIVIHCSHCKKKFSLKPKK